MNISNHFILFIFVATLMTTGCAAQSQYAWSNYDQKLYNHYQNPTKSEQFIEDLRKIIQYGEISGRVPPGIYAEYGYALYEQGNYPEAIEYFKKEQSKWPESDIIMTKMINNAQKIIGANKEIEHSAIE